MIAAGGTAGHVVPALAIADALRAEGAEVVFAAASAPRRELVPAAGYELETLRVEGISRSNPLKAARAVAARRRARSAPRAQMLRAATAPTPCSAAAATSPGPVGLAAVHEADPARADRGRQPPRAHQPPARAARPPRLPRVPDRGARRRALPASPGGPVPPPVTDREAARAAFGIAPDDRVVLIFGGSLGARSINLAAVEAFADAPFRVLHVAGRARLRRPAARPARTTSCASTSTPFGQALAAADLAVARAGGSVFELAQYGLPAVLVPYPHASADHQTANARWMAEAGAATSSPTTSLTPRGCAREVDGLLADPRRLRAMAAASRGARPAGRRRRTSRARCSPATPRPPLTIQPHSTKPLLTGVGDAVDRTTCCPSKNWMNRARHRHRDAEADRRVPDAARSCVDPG